jgi:hypothetical protein
MDLSFNSHPNPPLSREGNTLGFVENSFSLFLATVFGLKFIYQDDDLQHGDKARWRNNNVRTAT